MFEGMSDDEEEFQSVSLSPSEPRRGYCEEI